MQKKAILLSIIALFLGIQASAQPISSQTAQHLAQDFWLHHFGNKAEKLFVEIPSSYDALHLFNAEDGEGFVIVAADERATTILGYSDNDILDTAKMPPALLYWLQGYNDQVLFACQHEAPIAADNTPAKELDSVAALVPVTWDQGRFYNDSCPVDNTLRGQDLNLHPYTGCAATAMAQVMRYWNWPPHGIGNYSYSWAGVVGFSWHYGTLSADFEHTTYDWRHMPAKLTASSTDEEKAAVAKLMYHCGVSVQMSYNNDHQGSSGAFLTLENISGMRNGQEYCVENALYTFFGYKSTLQGLFREDYPDSTWITMLKEELRAGRPILYQGRSSNGQTQSGHCFILDGFDTEDHFHINWGWNGHYNAYYAISALSPYSNCNYSYSQGGLFGVVPDYAAILLRSDDTVAHPLTSPNSGPSSLLDAPTAPSNNIRTWGLEGSIHVSGAQGQEVVVSDMMGRTCCRMRCHSDNERIVVPSSGIYLVRIGRETMRKTLVR